MEYLCSIWIITALTVVRLQEVHGGQSVPFTKEDFPDPRVNFKECGRYEASWVCDPGSFLTKDKADELDNRINSVQGIGKENALMVAVVPAVLGQDGRATNKVEELRKFTNYLHQKSWSQYADNILVLAYFVTQHEVWAQTGSSSSAGDCICQLTYESQQYIKSGFYTILDIFTSKFVDILSGRGSCTRQGPGVPWRVDSTGACVWDKEKTIAIFSVNPLKGPPDGRTEVVIRGQRLDLTEGPVLIGDINCRVLSRDEKRIECITTPLPAGSSENSPLPVTLLLSGGVKYDTGRRFVYTTPSFSTIRPRTTTISGGLVVTVNGENLDLVKTAIMVTTLTGTQTGTQIVYNSTCEVESPSEILCPTPKLDVDSVRSRRRKRDLTGHMTKRAVDDGEPSTLVDGVSVSAVLVIDGERIPLKVNLTVYEDPELYTFEGESRTLTFISVWPKSERIIDIRGLKLLPALEGHTLTVQIGEGFCSTVQIPFSNLLRCHPPIKEPQKTANNTHPLVRAHIGKLPYDIGYLEYWDTLWKYPLTRYVIIGIVAGILIIFGIIVSCCLCCSLRKVKR